MKSIEFTTDWFVPHVNSWRALIPQYCPRKILEIGSFEGRSTCFLIDELASPEAPLEIHCVDTWGGGREHAEINMTAVESRFDSNIALTIQAHPGASIRLRKRKGLSIEKLSEVIAEGHVGSFDMVYVDGSHESPDVLGDAVLGFHLLKVGGLMVFDDYVWGLGLGADPVMSPKFAIDSFSNIFGKKIQPHPWMPLCQIYFRKLSN